MPRAPAAGNTGGGPRQSREPDLHTAIPPLLLTRPHPASERFAAGWRARAGGDARAVISPVTEIVALPLPAGIGAGRIYLFSSENGVAAAGRAPAGARAWCVGARTAAAARAAGFAARAAGGTADALVAAVMASGERGPYLHLRGRRSRGEVAARLAAAGLDCREAVAYDQRPLPLSDEARALLAAPGRVLVPLFSPDSARRLGAALSGVPVAAALLVAAMSPAVAAAWTHPATSRVLRATRPTAAAMTEALLALGAGEPP